jgi:hypothetical protein
MNEQLIEGIIIVLLVAMPAFLAFLIAALGRVSNNLYRISLEIGAFRNQVKEDSQHQYWLFEKIYREVWEEKQPTKKDRIKAAYQRTQSEQKEANS